MTVPVNGVSLDKEKAEKAHECGPCQHRVWVVRHRTRPNLDWRVLAKDADEAKRTVLADEPRLAYERLTAEEARP